MNARPKSAPLFFQPESLSARSNNSLIADAKYVLDILKTKAQKMTDEVDYPPPSYGSSEQSDNMFYSTHFVKVMLNDLAITEARFFAIQDIIELAINNEKISIAYNL